jgi:hypothetical protein
MQQIEAGKPGPYDDDIDGVGGFDRRYRHRAFP